MSHVQIGSNQQHVTSHVSNTVVHSTMDSNFFDKEIGAKIRQLEDEKNRSVANENFESAKFYKQQVDRLRAISV